MFGNKNWKKGGLSIGCIKMNNVIIDNFEFLPDIIKVRKQARVRQTQYVVSIEEMRKTQQ